MRAPCCYCNCTCVTLSTAVALIIVHNGTAHVSKIKHVHDRGRSQFPLFLWVFQTAIRDRYFWKYFIFFYFHFETTLIPVKKTKQPPWFHVMVSFSTFCLGFLKMPKISLIYTALKITTPSLKPRSSKLTCAVGSQCPHWLSFINFNWVLCEYKRSTCTCKIKALINNPEI